MNFIKRAGHNLWARKVRSLMLIGLFFVICSLVLCGVLLRAATDQAATAAKQRVGSDVTLQWDMEKAMEEGDVGLTMPDEAALDTGKADRPAKSPLVENYNYVLESGTAPADIEPVEAGEPPEDLPEDMAEGMLPLQGVRESGLLPGFKDGRTTIVDGEPITAEDADRDVVLIEERLAEHNDLSVGDEVELADATGENPRTFEVIGIFSDPTKSPKTWSPPESEPGNMMYVPVDAIGRLDSQERIGDGTRIHEAVYQLKDPDQLEEFREQVADAGIDMDVFTLDANDKLYRKLVGPIEGVAGFAGVGVWLIAIAGAAILALLVMMGTRERRTELGVLLSIGERRWKLVAQQLVEMLAVAVLALGMSLAIGQSFSQWAGDALLSGQLAAAEDEADEEEPGPGGAAPVGGGANSDDEPDADPVDELTVSLQPSDALAVAGIGVGIAAAATTLPALTILRYQPRSILAKGD